MRIDTEKTLWTHKGDNFTVEICVWRNPEQVIPDEVSDIVPVYHWNVYAYIFPKHPMFDQITKDDLFDYGVDIPLHWGASYHKWTYDKNNAVSCKQIGCDYQHLHDDRFGRYSTREEAWEVFRDAENLIEFMNDRIKSAVHGAAGNSTAEDGSPNKASMPAEDGQHT